MLLRNRARKTHKKQPSIHDLDLEKTENVLSALKFFNDKELSKPEIEATVEIKPLGDAIKKTIKSLQKITEYKQQHPGEDVQVRIVVYNLDLDHLMNKIYVIRQFPFLLSTKIIINVSALRYMKSRLLF